MSAPLLKRKTSRFGLGQFLTGNTINNPSNVASTHTAHSHLHQSQSHQYLQVNNVPKQTHHHHRSLHSPLPSSGSGPPRSPVSPSTHSNHHHFHFHSHHQTTSAQSQLQASPTHPSHQDHQQKQQNVLPQQQNQTAGVQTGKFRACMSFRVSFTVENYGKKYENQRKVFMNT